MIYDIFIQILLLLFALFRQKIIGKCVESQKTQTVSMDVKEISVIEDLLLSLIFCLFAPLIIPLNIINISLQIFLLKIKHDKLKWKFKTKHIKQLTLLPTRILLINTKKN